MRIIFHSKSSLREMQAFSFPNIGFPGLGRVQFQRATHPPPKGKRGSPAEKEYYDLLEVSPNADSKEIKTAYRRKSVSIHPDKNTDGDNTEFIKLKEAYEVLGDEVQRACYDAFGKEFDKTPCLQDFIRTIKHEDIEAKLDVTLKECVNGAEKVVEYNRKNEKGRLEATKHTMFVPPGTYHEQVFTFAGIGHQEPGKVNGSLVVIINMQPDKEFQRVGNILICEKTLNLAEAISGRMTIEHPNGTQYSVANKMCFQPEQWYCIEQAGVTKEQPLFIHTKVVLPELPFEQKRLLCQLLGMPVNDAKDTQYTTAPFVDSRVVERRVMMARQEQAQDSEHVQPPQCQQQ